MSTSYRSSAVLFVLLAGLAACSASQPPASSAAGTAAQAASSSAAAEAPTAPAAASEAADAPTAIPDTAAAIWQAIDAKHEELGKVVASGDLHQVHHLAFAIRDLVAALPAKSPGLGADAQKALADGGKFVATLADRLDASGDANDRPGSQANFEKLEGVLKGLPRGK